MKTIQPKNTIKIGDRLYQKTVAFGNRSARVVHRNLKAYNRKAFKYEP